MRIRNIKIFFGSTIILLFVTCTNNHEKLISNNDFKSQLDSYLNYVDSTGGHTKDLEYIYVQAKKGHDTTSFVITLLGGSYDFLVYRKLIKDFFNYKGIDIMLIGDYPNDIVQIGENKNLDIIGDILKKRYLKDYEKYRIDPHSVGPLIYDYKTIILVFKKDHLSSVRRL